MKARKAKKKDELMASFGRRGGNAILKRHGRGHFKKMAEARWAKKRGAV